MSERWISARYSGKCSECECDISEGERVLYCPNESRRADVYCSICGDDYLAAEAAEDYEVDFD